MYRAWFSLRSPARDSRWRTTWPLEASSGAVPVWAAKWCLVGNRRTSPTSPSSLAASTGPTPNSPTRPVLDLGHRRGDARLDRGDPPVQVADVGDEVGGELVAGAGLCAGRVDPAE